jgi:hypothetical protein
MYYPNAIEEICYEQDHIDKVFETIKENIPQYIQEFIDTEGGTISSDVDLDGLKETFKTTEKPKRKKKNIPRILQKLLDTAIDDFNKDRSKYENVLDMVALKEYKEDVNAFKNTVLRNQIPIIQHTLQNRSAKELDKYRKSFNIAGAGELFTVAKNITTLANKWKNKWYDSRTFEKISKYHELDYSQFDDEEYIAYGVIGGGIKSHFIYKLFPCMYPNRSRDAIWALWYLSDKKRFNCKEDSEFLMIDLQKVITQQNFFYPYALFSFYALQIFLELKKVYKIHEIKIPSEYRFVIVDHFLSFVAGKHDAEINSLKSQAREGYQYEH